MRIANNLESSSETLVALIEVCWSMSSVGLFDSNPEGTFTFPFLYTPDTADACTVCIVLERTQKKSRNELKSK